MTALTLPVFVSLPPAFAQTDWQVVKTFQIGGEGGWDYLTVDPQTHRLYVPRTTHTMVIDAESGKAIADIPGQKNAHGVALAPAAGRGFISDGAGDGAIVIFDLKTNAVLGSLAAMPDADGIIFDPPAGTFWSCRDAERRRRTSIPRTEKSMSRSRDVERRQTGTILEARDKGTSRKTIAIPAVRSRDASHDFQ